MARSSRDLLVAAHQQITRKWWEGRRQVFELYVSEFVAQESRLGDIALAQRRIELVAGIADLTATPMVLQLAKELISQRVVPESTAPDAAHIAAATVHRCDYLLTWNCRHIANAELSPALRRIVKEFGLDLPVLCTPEELMGGGS